MRGIRNKICITYVLHMLNLHQMTFTEVCRADTTNFVHLCAGDDPIELWHRQLEHLNVRSVYALQSMMRGRHLGKTSHPTSTLVCKTCIESKQHAAKLGNDAERQTTKISKIVHLGVCVVL